MMKICLLFLIGMMIACNVQAQTWECGEHCSASLNDEGVLTISGSGKMNHYDPTEGIVPPWAGNDKVSKVVIEDGIEDIGVYAFYATMMSDIEIPSTVKSIGFGAFAWSKLQTIDIPNSVMEIARGVFRDVPLQSISIADTTKLQTGNTQFQGVTTLQSIMCQGSLSACQANLSGALRFADLTNAVEWYNTPRRIYTVEEARAAVEAAGTDTVNVRIRYK